MARGLIQAALTPADNHSYCRTRGRECVFEPCSGLQPHPAHCLRQSHTQPPATEALATTAAPNHHR